jgi:tagaturonate epimerase
LIHVAYKFAAEKMDKYLRLLKEHEEIVGEGVFENIYKRHICRLFL